MKKNQIIETILSCALTLTAILSMTASPSKAESLMEVVESVQLKKEMVAQLSASITRHKSMNLAEIKQELLETLNKNQEVSKAHGKLSTAALANFETIRQNLEVATSKDEIIKGEQRALKAMVSSSTQAIFYCLRGFYAERNSNFNFWTIFPPMWVIPAILFAVDMVTLPVTLTMSALTGW